MANAIASTVLVAIVAGVAGGGATALALGNREAPSPPTAIVVSAPPVGVRRPAPVRPRDEPRSAQATPPPEEEGEVVTPTEGADRVAPAPALDFAEIARLEQERLRHDLESHASEPVDLEWVAATEPTVTDDARSVAADNGFEHVRTSCRSQTCVVTYRWPTRPEARRSFASAVHHDYQANCATSLTLPEGNAEPFEASLVMRCR